MDILLETVCTNRKSIRVAGDDYPAELVKAKFLKLDSHHIHGMQFKGLGAPNKRFATQNKQMYVYTSALLATMVLVLRTLLKHENHFVNQTVRFQVQLEADGYFFLGSFRICNRSKQGDLVPTRKFLNLILQIRLQKHLLGFAQTRYSAQNCADCVS